MAQQVEALAADLSLISGIHVVEGENQLPQVCSDLHLSTLCAHTQID